MTNAEINVAIAEACGWRQSEVEIMAMHFPGGMLPSKVKRWFRGDWSELLSQGVEGVPDYCNDLNAMAEVEKPIDGKRAYIYSIELARLAGERFEWKATARQRAEAFLKTIGKWKTEDDDGDPALDDPQD